VIRIQLRDPNPVIETRTRSGFAFATCLYVRQFEDRRTR